MPYVMLPVPEEHVQEAMEAVLRIQKRASLTDWDADSTRTLYNEVDEASRSLLAIVARAELNGQKLDITSLADATHITSREVSGIIRELNSQAADAGRPPMLLSAEVDEVLPNGRTRVVRVTAMPRTLATFINTAEREELAAAPNPLAGFNE